MNGFALLGLFLIIYAAVVVVLALKKPTSMWNMGKIRFFRKVFGEKGVVIFFWVLAAVAAGFGVWLLIR